MDGHDSASTEADAPFVNYMPGMPPLSTEEGPLERALRSLLARRGTLRPAGER
jgi:hypothetical protein